WRYPSAQWVKDCERLVELDARLPAILNGEAQPAGARERIDYAEVCYYKKLYASSARFMADAFAAEPGLADEVHNHRRSNAACVAVLTGSGQGADAERLSEEERAGWRRQALEWLRADLAAWANVVASGTPQSRVAAERSLQRWRHDTDLAGVRDPAAL